MKFMKQVVSREIAKAPFTFMVYNSLIGREPGVSQALLKALQCPSPKKSPKWVSIVPTVNIAVPEDKREVRVYGPTDMNAHVMEQV